MFSYRTSTTSESIVFETATTVVMRQQFSLDIAKVETHITLVVPFFVEFVDLEFENKRRKSIHGLVLLLHTE